MVGTLPYLAPVHQPTLWIILCGRQDQPCASEALSESGLVLPYS